MIKYACLMLPLLVYGISKAQTIKTNTPVIKTDTVLHKTDTVEGVVVYTGHSDLRYIAKGNFHTYTVGATEVISDTGVVSIRTEFGYLDLKRNYVFYPLNKVQPARLKKKP
jgi:hypothetical protein